MSAPLFIQRAPGANLSGFMDPDGSKMRVGIGATAVGVGALYGAYRLWKSNHKVAGVVVGLLFGPSLLIGPEMVAEYLRGDFTS